MLAGGLPTDPPPSPPALPAADDDAVIDAEVVPDPAQTAPFDPLAAHLPAQRAVAAPESAR
jgi:hypothetical protein